MYYNQILALRDIPDNNTRRILLLTIIREILPWSLKPDVISIISETSQAEQSYIYRWHDISFIIEADVSEPNNSSNLWEKFEALVRSKQGACIGIYICLYSVDKSMRDAAEKMCREKRHNILLEGSVWDELDQEGLSG